MRAECCRLPCVHDPYLSPQVLLGHEVEEPDEENEAAKGPERRKRATRRESILPRELL